MTATNVVRSPGQMREAYGLKLHRALGERPWPTAGGEWRLDTNGQWRLWQREVGQ